MEFQAQCHSSQQRAELVAEAALTQSPKDAKPTVRIFEYRTARLLALHLPHLQVAAHTAESAGGLDGVLHAIKKPSSVSTMAKSSVDWDAFKEESNLGDELEQATKDGYLQRQDFLTRCDVRQF